MTKQPTRLADFEIPREQTVKPASGSAAKQDGGEPAKPAFLQHAAEVRGQVQMPTAPAAVPPAAEPEASRPAVQAEAPIPVPAPPPALPAAVQVPQPMPRPVEEPRRQIGARVRVGLAERLRTYMFVSRESQQDAVEAALDAYLSSKGF
ncbi:hypothetical protein [Roseicella sp. DB1501]|uniref:hypothetical protein n=1 Tax=Roseicella sp. DB1501 TaxID=2730925 RepID=UPI0014929E0B|nr:hypothetical protein [Roseicella sp. DB1501]NOG74028.1 hypothetical protein [Roseicella sp. DB1501]